VIFATISITSALVACSSNNSGTVLAPGQTDTTAAIAAVRGYTDSTLSGTVTFRQEGDSVKVTSNLSGLNSGTAYDLQIRQTGSCLAPGGSGGDFPAGTTRGNTADSLSGRIRVGSNGGMDSATFRTSVLSLNSSENASIIGRSVVLQANVGAIPVLGDTAWVDVACGIITAGNVADTSRTATGTGTDSTTGTPGTPGTGTDPGTTGVFPGNG